MSTPTRKIIVNQALWIVCKAEFRDQMNASLATVDSAGSPEVLSSGLARVGDSTGTYVAYWTNWGMDDTQRTQMNQMFAQQGWRPLKGTEGTVLKQSDSVPAFSTNQRWWLWDGITVPSSHVLSSLGLTPVYLEEG